MTHLSMTTTGLQSAPRSAALDSFWARAAGSNTRCARPGTGVSSPVPSRRLPCSLLSTQPRPHPTPASAAEPVAILTISLCMVDDGIFEEYSWPPVSSHLGPSTPSFEPLEDLLQSYHWPPLSPHFQPSPSGLRPLAASPDAPGLDLQPLPSLSSVASPVHDPLSSLDPTPRLPPQESQPPSSLPDRPSNVVVHCLPAWALSRPVERQPELVDGSTLSRYPMNNVTTEFLRIEPLVNCPP